MSILGEEDLIKQLGKGIYVHPLKSGSIRACNFCLKELFSESKTIGLVFISLLTFLAGRFTMSDNEWIRNISNMVSIILGALFFIFVVWGLYKFITKIIDKQSLEEN